MRFAYADPPYIGQAKRHYSHEPPDLELSPAGVRAMAAIRAIGSSNGIS